MPFDQMQWTIACIGVVGLLCAACTSGATPDAASVEPTALPAPTASPTPAEPSTVPESETLERLTMRYEACVREAGVTNAQAQVLRFNGGLVVKTAPEIPAAIHSPCFLAIGGSPTLAGSSWGSVTGPGAVDVIRPRLPS